jgi:DNA-directed RNA polymerase specialized sigma24 family protein
VIAAPDDCREFETMKGNDDDLALVRRALFGDEEAAAEIHKLGPQLVNYLISKGAPRGSVSEDAVADFLGDCFGARERSPRASTNRILELYKGDGPLIAWLKKSCWNKYIDGIKGITLVPLPEKEESDGGAEAQTAPRSADPEVKARILAALEFAFSEIDSLQLIFLRLVYFEDVNQKDVAAVFNYDDTTVSRHVSKGLETLRKKFNAFQKRYPDSLQMEWSDLLEICQSPPNFFYEN